MKRFVAVEAKCTLLGQDMTAIIVRRQVGPWIHVRRMLHGQVHSDLPLGKAVGFVSTMGGEFGNMNTVRRWLLSILHREPEPDVYRQLFPEFPEEVEQALLEWAEDGFREIASPSVCPL